MAVFSRVKCIVIGVDVYHLRVKLVVDDRNRVKVVWEHADNLGRYHIDEIVPSAHRVMQQAGWF